MTRGRHKDQQAQSDFPQVFAVHLDVFIKCNNLCPMQNSNCPIVSLQKIKWAQISSVAYLLCTTCLFVTDAFKIRPKPELLSLLFYTSVFFIYCGTFLHFQEFIKSIYMLTSIVIFAWIPKKYTEYWYLSLLFIRNQQRKFQKKKKEEIKKCSNNSSLKARSPSCLLSILGHWEFMMQVGGWCEKSWVKGRERCRGGAGPRGVQESGT